MSTQPAESWVATWAAAQQRVDPSIAPPEPGLSNVTLRQVVRVSVGGERVRVKFSNEFGRTPLTIVAAGVAPSPGKGRIDVRSVKCLTFGGNASVTIAPKTFRVSDPLNLSLPPLSDLAVTIKLDHVDESEITTHPGARCTSLAIGGDRMNDESLDDGVASAHWYYLAAVEVESNRKAIVCLGDSITDGRGSTTDGNGRWTDALARRLAGKLAVINSGIGGNRVLHDGLGPSAVSRFDRDVLNIPGVRYAIVLEGVNDLGTAKPDAADAVAEELIGAFAAFVEQAHAKHVTILGGTITPIGGSHCDHPLREAARRRLNAFVRGTTFDGHIDFDAAVRDASEPTKLDTRYDSGDHLHLNDAGYIRMADAADLTRFAGGR